MAPAVPNFELPEIVVAFDFSLEPRLARWSKDRHDPRTETQMDQASQTTGLLVRALKARVIVKLGETRSAKSTPMRFQTGEGVFRREGGTRPGNSQAAIEGNAVEDFHRRDAFDGQTFDEIKGVEFSVTVGQLWQIPTRWRRWAALTRANNHALPGQDPGDRALRRQRRNFLFLKVAEDSGGTKFAQRGMSFEPEPRREYALLNAKRSPILGFWISARGILPITPIESFSFGAVKPFKSRAQTDVEPSRDGAERSATTQSGNNEPALEKGFFSVTRQQWLWCQYLLRGLPDRSAPARCARLHYPVREAPNIPTGSLRAFTICCHESVYHFLSLAHLRVRAGLGTLTPAGRVWAQSSADISVDFICNNYSI
jgi:hypothetical protein